MVRRAHVGAELLPRFGWKWLDVVSKYIETQDVHHAKNASYRP